MLKKIISIIGYEPTLIIALPFSIILFLLLIIIRPIIQIRVGFLRSDRLGHFAANTELYLCERDFYPNKSRSFDIFYFARKPCNDYLAKMWRRRLIILPWFFMRPLDLIIRTFSFLSPLHAFEARGGDRDIDNLYEKTGPHLQFEPMEIDLGEACLRRMGIPSGAKFICLTVRDSAYLNKIYQDGKGGSADSTYHDYRDSSIDKYIQAAENLAKHGFYVVRMGVVVNSPMNTTNPKIIDYAKNGMRSEFMDIYLGAKCEFCISVGTGFDAIPAIFRRPILQVNNAPIGYAYTWGRNSFFISKHHIDIETGKRLSLRDIFARGAAFCLDSKEFLRKGITLRENSSEEINHAVIEMIKHLNGTLKLQSKDDLLQHQFWKIYHEGLRSSNQATLHGDIHSRYSLSFLRNNQSWLN